MSSESASHADANSEKTNGTDIDIFSYHEENAGRLIVDPQEAKRELGELVAAKLKLTADGRKVLWPQPTDDPEDPQNWSTRRKTLQLIIVTLASIIPAFDSGTGIPAIFALAQQFHVKTGVINNVTSNWSIFLLGWGGMFAVMPMRRYGRLPVLFWSQLIALGFLVGCTFATNLSTFAAMRCLTAFFGTTPQVSGLFSITDMYPWHLQARKMNIWTMGYIASPFLSPFVFGFLVARTAWQWAYGIACMYGAVVLLLIIFFGEETIYDRTLHPVPPRPTQGLRYRIETLIGITGHKMSKYRQNWGPLLLAPLNVVWRPHLLLILIYEAMFFGFTIGINTTNVIFLGGSPPVGFGFKGFTIAGLYATPIVAVIIGELVGRYLNDFIANVNVRKNRGVFEAESRLWSCYLALVLYIAGFVLIGAAFQNHLSLAAVIFGWGLALFGAMINTVAVYAYCNDSFPKHQGEISALLHLVRVLGGFAVAYFQVPWAEKHGALQVFGVEAAIVAGMFIMIIPFVQMKGRALRARYSL